MPTDNLEYLDESGINRTGANVLAKIAEAKAQIEAELDSLDYAQPDGIYPDMTVGAVIGADETAQWATRESTGTGTATVRSVQGASVVLNQIVPDAGAHKSGTASSNTWVTTQTFAMTSGHKYLLIRSGAYPDYNNTCRVVSTTGTTVIYNSAPNTPNKQGSIFDCTETRDTYFVQAWVTSGEAYDFYLNVYDLTAMFGSGNEPATVAEFEAMFPAAYYPYSAPVLKPVQIAGIQSTDADGEALDAVSWEPFTLRGVGAIGDMLYPDHVETRIGVVDLGTLEWSKVAALTDESGYRFQASLNGASAPIGSTMCRCAELEVVPVPASFNSISKGQIFKYTTSVQVGGDSSLTQAQFKAAMSGVYLYYELDTPTTTPISPALPMTYRVQQGGTESTIVPDGEISAAPILTIADPVNMSTELAQIWAAIEALQGSRQTLQSNTRIDMQEITQDLPQIDVTKELQQTDEDGEVSE